MANSDYELFACARKHHVRHLLQQNDEQPKETPVSVGKRRKALHGHEDDESPSKKKAKEKLIKKLDEKRERVKKSLQDVAASSTSGGDYLTTTTAAGRRSSGRIRNKSENRCRHCSLFRVSFSVLSFKNYYFSPLKGSTHWCLC